MVNFPTPVGGTALPADFAPSILFAILYSLMVPLMLYRLFERRSRTILLIGTFTFSVERIVIFALRAVQSRSAAKRVSTGLATYMQISFGLGYIGIANDLVNLVRCLLVNPTYGSATFFQSPAASTKESHVSEPPENTPDYPKQRTAARQITGLLSLVFFAATVPGILANSHYSQVFDSQNQAKTTMRLRYASSGVALLLTLVLLYCTVWAQRKLPRASQAGIRLLLVLTVLLSIVGIYRLCVMFNTSSSLLSMGPGSLNSPGAKACFYIFHVLPEWMSNLILISVNVRKILGTGMWGDWRSKDETEKQRKKREEKEAKKLEKQKQKALLDQDGHETGKS